MFQYCIRLIRLAAWAIPDSAPPTGISYYRSLKAGKLSRAVSNFESIRPYRDEEVPSVVRRLTASAELRDGIASFIFPRLYKFSAVATRLLTRIMLALRATQLKTVYDVQMMVGRYIDHMVEASVDSLTWSGLETLDPAKPYLFISNHRDITLDSAFLSRVLHAEGFPTCEIAVGDNLFGTPHADDLMRLNRGFLVERAAGGPKAAYAALKRTSSYIRHSLASGASVWIAQREGRAKDGFDRTDPALIKMLALAWRKTKSKPQGSAPLDHSGNISLSNDSLSNDSLSNDSLAISQIDELLLRVNLVPVAISYELDPCDLLKAEELFHLTTEGSFTKAEGADLASIVAGMRGYKGRIHLNFAQPMRGSFDSADGMALAIDKAIVSQLKIYPSNVHAWQQAQMGSELPSTLHLMPENSRSMRYFEKRIESIGSNQRPYLLMQYANLLRNRLELGLDPAPGVQ